MRTIVGSVGMVVVINAEAGSLSNLFENLQTQGQIRTGAIQIENPQGERSKTVALGGYVVIKTNPISGVSAGVTFYTTNALFGQNEEARFLSSDAKSYSILGEAYIQATLGKTTIKVGRQTVETPYAQSDDIGMVPDRFEGIGVVNQDITDTTIVVASLNQWSGFDSNKAEKFTHLQASGDAVLTAGAIYEGLENTTLQAWHYTLDNANFNYIEAGYETEQYTLALQYTDQDNSNRAYGVAAGINFGDLVLATAYNRVDGEVNNGFGGGPFFTSSEDHTIAEAKDQEALLLGAEYVYDTLTVALSHVAFDKGENETDYLLSYAFNDKMSLDLIYSDMYDDGKMTRVFANYNF